MGPFTAGEVVIVRFPFSDLTASKLRPALILADAGRGDWILSQITSNTYGDAKAVQIDSSDFIKGSLRITSHARPGKLFTAHASLIASQAGKLRTTKFDLVRKAVVQLIEKG